MASIIAAAKNTGAEAIHPGYGFLAENAEFAAPAPTTTWCSSAPPLSASTAWATKSSARETMKMCGVPTVPGSDGCLDAVEEAAAFAEKVGYPVLIKATAGGGGKGMREVHDPADLAAQYKAAPHRGRRRLGNDGVYRKSSCCARATWRCRCSPTITATLWPSASATAPSSAAIRSFWKRPPRRRFPRTCAAT